MRSSLLGVVTIALVSAACGSDGSPASELESELADYLVAYDDHAMEVCECEVARGAFPSMQECMRLIGSGPDWMECIVGVLEEHQEEFELEDGRCATRALSERTDCLDEASCDVEAQTVCYDAADAADLACEAAGPNGIIALLGPELSLQVIQDCDLGLLGRVE